MDYRKPLSGGKTVGLISNVRKYFQQYKANLFNAK